MRCGHVKNVLKVSESLEKSVVSLISSSSEENCKKARKKSEKIMWKSKIRKPDPEVISKIVDEKSLTNEIFMKKALEEILKVLRKEKDIWKKTY